MKKVLIYIILAIFLVTSPAYSDVVLKAAWSDGESKAEVPQKIMPFKAEWSDGSSIIIITYTTLTGAILMYHYMHH